MACFSPRRRPREIRSGRGPLDVRLGGALNLAKLEHTIVSSTIDDVADSLSSAAKTVGTLSSQLTGMTGSISSSTQTLINNLLGRL
jgi:hypothetical protein